MEELSRGYGYLYKPSEEDPPVELGEVISVIDVIHCYNLLI